MKLARFSVALGVAGLLTACGDGLPVPPTAPAEFRPGVSLFHIFSVSGEVTEMTSAGATPVKFALVRETASNRSAKTDYHGRYVITGLRSTVTLAVSKVGFVANSVSQTITGNTQINIQLDRRPTYSLSGVISEMTPTGLAGIEGVEVYFGSDLNNTTYAEGETMTDGQGRYRLTGVWGQDALNRIWLQKTGYAIDTDPSCEFCFRTLTISGDTVLDIRLERLPLPSAPRR
jgi:hypothetical protein